MPLFEKRVGFRPIEYQYAYDAFVKSEQMHWLPREIPLNADVQQWKNELSDAERNLLTQIFRFFTQADIDVASGYIETYLPVFKPTELRMMMTSIAAREAVHIQAYAMLIDEVGIPETEYAAFMEYQEMKDKHDFLFERDTSGLSGLSEDIAVFSAFGEGLQLFASFVMLLNFTRFGKMTGMGQIVSWSIRDETHHVESMIKLYHTLLSEHPELDTAALETRVTNIAMKMVELEDRFIDLAFAQGGIEGLTAEDTKQYIRYIADIRLQQLHYPIVYGVAKNPLPWVDVIVFGKEHVNFFENRASDYSAGAVEGSWGDAFDDDSDEELSTLPSWAKGVYMIHSKPNCPGCARAETMLQVKRLPYSKILYETPEQLEEFKSKGFRSFPQVYHDEVLVGSDDNLRKYLAQ